MQTRLIDTHAHIYLPEFEADQEEMIKRAKSAGVTAIYMPAIDSSTHALMLQSEERYPLCKSMIGLHPCSVKSDFEKEIAVVTHYLAQRKFIAIGEIGLDFYWDKTFAEQQYIAFHQQIELAQHHNLPVVVHSRNATEECIATVSQYSGLRGVFHCFSGDEQQALKLVELGFYLGIGGVVTYKNSGLDKVVQAVGLSHLLLETDAPYLSPVPYRGKRNEPAYTEVVARRLAALLTTDVVEIASITTANAKKLFQIEQKP